MLYQVNGRLLKKEYMENKLWTNKKLFIIVVILTFFVMAYTIREMNWPLYYIEIYGEYLLRETTWVFVILLFFTYFLFLWVLSSLAQVGYTLALKEYTFNEMGLKIRMENGETRLPWEELNKVTVSAIALTLYFQNNNRVYVPFRFFLNRTQRDEVIALVRTKEGKH